MTDLTFSLDIATPPNEIFVFFVPQRMPLWYGTEMNAKFEVQGGAPDFAIGQKVRITGDLSSYELILTAVITAYEAASEGRLEAEPDNGIKPAKG